MNFSDYTKLRWEKLSDSDKKFATMNALNAASAVMSGSQISSDVFIAYAEEILTHFYEFEQFKKPSLIKEVSVLQTNKKRDKGQADIPFK